MTPGNPSENSLVHSKTVPSGNYVGFLVKIPPAVPFWVCCKRVEASKRGIVIQQNSAGEG